MTTINKGYAVYTDGGSLKNGYTGAGTYILELDLTRQVETEAEGIKLSGYDVVKKSDHAQFRIAPNMKEHNRRYPILRTIEIWQGFVEGTNNTGELHGLLNALTYLKDQAEEGCPIALIMDSQYCIKPLTGWLKKWRENEWRTSSFTPVANADLWKQVDALHGKGEAYSLFWVRGHTSNIGNEKADELATRGIAAAQSGDEQQHVVIRTMEEAVAIEKEKKKIKPKYNRMLAGSSSVYFMAGKPEEHTSDGRVIYHVGNHGNEDHKIRVDDPESTIAVVLAKEPDPVLSLLQKQYMDAPPKFPKLAILKLNAITSPRLYGDLALEGLSETFKDHDRDTFHTLSIKEDILVRIEHAPRVAFKFLKSIELLKESLSRFVVAEGKDTLDKGDRIIDVTDQFYKEGKKRMELADHLDASVLIHKVHVDLTLASGLKVKAGTKLNSDGKSIIPLSVGKDMPPLNTIRSVAGPNTKAYLYFRQISSQGTHGLESHTYDVSVIIEHDGIHNDLLIWSTPMRSRLFMTFGA